MIYFASFYLKETVHCIPLGFTNYLHKYVETDDTQSVTEIIQQWCHANNIAFDRVVSVSTARLQDRRQYTFPEQIL